jgi:hypothetical protein
MAPVTGSDALHYHFATPAATLRDGFLPDFFLAHSFLTGQGHLLILLGLAFHSERLALALLFLGGVLAAAAGACLARAWVSPSYAWLTALAFLLTPVIFWQLTVAGAPDLWMAFFSAVGVLAVAHASKTRETNLAVISGMCAGIAAGTKYTGCFLAASLLVAFVWETRRLRLALLFLAASLGAGVWPYARNFAWTGDPVFPFALQWFPKAPVNAQALGALLADTGVTTRLGLWEILKFPFLASIDPKHLGFWQFFGPLCLLFAPMFLFLLPRYLPPPGAPWTNIPKTGAQPMKALWRTSLILWFASAVAVGRSSGTLRFLVATFPVVLACTFAGVAAVEARSSRFLRSLAAATVAVTLLTGFAGLLVYERPALAAGIGLVPREKYLQERAQEYAVSEFIDRTVSAQPAVAGVLTGRTLVFLRHVYLLHVPYFYGGPDDSWPVDPEHLRTASDWLAFLHQHNIRWVVRSPDYPPAIAAPLRALEEQGGFSPIAQTEVRDFHGMRILDDQRLVRVVILRVRP